MRALTHSCVNLLSIISHIKQIKTHAIDDQVVTSSIKPTILTRQTNPFHLFSTLARLRGRTRANPFSLVVGGENRFAVLMRTASNVSCVPHLTPAVWLSVLLVLTGFSAAAVTTTNLVGWGAGITNSGAFPDYGQASGPAGLSNVIAIAAGAYHSVAIKADGTVFAWGDGELERTNVPAGLSNVTAVVAWDHTLALKSDGNVIAWGNNAYGRTNVPSGLSNVVAIGVGQFHSLAASSDGTLVAWGAGLTNQGSGAVNRGQSLVPANLRGVIAVDGGVCHSLALRADGTVVAWGAGASNAGVFPDYGQSLVPSSLNGVTAISAGGYHSLALTTNGTVTAWGYDNVGQTDVPPGLSNVVAISAGVSHSLALKSDGTVVSWGATGYGAQNVPTGLADIYLISAGGEHSLALQRMSSPTIASGPSNVVALEGSSVNFSITAGGTGPFAYQWQKNGTNLVDLGAVSGTTQKSLELGNLTTNDSGSYLVLVSNSLGTATSSPALLEVRDFLYVGDGQVIASDRAFFLRSAIIELQTAIPAGWIFYTLDGSDPTTSGFLYEKPFTVTNSCTVRAIAYAKDFSQSQTPAPLEITVGAAYVLTAYSIGGGTVSISPSNSPVSGGTLAMVTATPETGWSFLEWRGDFAGTNSVSNVLMDRDRIVEAVFGTSVATNVVGNGSISLDTVATLYPYGTALQLTPVPGSNSYFVSWGGSIGGSAVPLSLDITTATQSITAAFANLTPGFCTLTVVDDGRGQATVSPWTNRFSIGQQTVLTATPDEGQQFLGWSGDASGTQNPLTVTLSGNTAITAMFTSKPFVFIDPPLDGLKPDLFRFTIRGERGATYSIQASTNFLNWDEVGLVTNSLGTVKFDDLAAPAYNGRYYQAQTAD